MRVQRRGAFASTAGVVHLEYETDVLRLGVADDGDGEPAALRKVVRQEVPGLGGGYHRGLADVAARLRELGGVLAVERSHLGGIGVDIIFALASVRAGNTADPPGGNDG
jgi:signal transduction histidine kinase